jgi:hypothetical protein
MNIIHRYLVNQAKKESYMYDEGEYAQLINRDRRSVYINGKTLRTNECTILPYKSALTFANMLNYNLQLIVITRS